MTDRDRGQALVVVLGVVAVAALLVVAVASVGGRLVRRDRAQAAADAVALAAVVEGRAGAAALAARNGASLVSYQEDGDEVTVVVAVDGERATARATDGP